MDELVTPIAIDKGDIGLDANVIAEKVGKLGR